MYKYIIKSNLFLIEDRLLFCAKILYNIGIKYALHKG